MDTRQRLQEFVVSEFEAAKQIGAIGPNDDLMGLGIVDSMGALQIVSFIEETFGTPVDDMEITVQNFRTIDSIAKFVDRKLAAS